MKKEQFLRHLRDLRAFFADFAILAAAIKRGVKRRQKKRKQNGKPFTQKQRPLFNAKAITAKIGQMNPLKSLKKQIKAENKGTSVCAVRKRRQAIILQFCSLRARSAVPCLRRCCRGRCRTLSPSLPLRGGPGGVPRNALPCRLCRLCRGRGR